MGGVIWVKLTWGETSKSKQRGPLRASRDPGLVAVESEFVTVAAPNGNNRKYWIVIKECIEVKTETIFRHFLFYN